MAGEPTLYEGDIDVYGWVFELHRLLDDRGHPSNDEPGVFGPATTAAVKALQSEKGCDPDGIVGEQTWSAVRGEHPLRPEGIANQPFGDTRDTRTGLARQGSVDEYVDDTTGVVYSSMSAEDRADKLIDAANEQLAAAGVPPIRKPPTWTATGNTWAEFDFTNWGINLNPTNFDPAYYETLTPDQADDVAVTVYHEARHAEQWWRMARERAGLGATVAVLTGNPFGYDQQIAEMAVADPILQCDAAQYEAEEWYVSVYGAGGAARNNTLTDPAAPYDDYRRLPEERDAWGVGSEVEQEFDENLQQNP